MPNISLRADSESERQAVIKKALSWVGTPFHPGAQLKGIGVDCGTFLLACFGAAGISVPRDVGYFPRDWFLHTKEERYRAFIEQYARAVESPEPGDVVMFRLGKHVPYSHGAIVIEWPQVVHAYWGKGVEVSDATKFPRADREVLFYSPWGMATVLPSE